jgi:hypothetical protein
VVIQPLVVISAARIVIQSGVTVTGQQYRRYGRGADEIPPAFQRRQVTVRI